MNIPKVLAAAFFMQQLWWLLLNYVLVQKEFSLNKLVSFMYKYKSLQVCQLPQEHLSFLQNFLNFIITKYLKQEVDDNLSLCVVERSPCGLSNWRYKDLQMSRDEKVMTLLWRSALSTSITGLLLLPNFDNSSCSVIRDREICHMIMS